MREARESAPRTGIWITNDEAGNSIVKFYQKRNNSVTSSNMYRGLANLREQARPQGEERGGGRKKVELILILMRSARTHSGTVARNIYRPTRVGPGEAYTG